MNILYHAYSLDMERYLGSFNATAYEGDRTGINYKQWCESFDEKTVRIINWDGEWFQTVDDSMYMSKLRIDQLPKEIQMKLLIGVL